MTVLKEYPSTIKEAYNKLSIGQITLNREPFLVTGEALTIGSSIESFDGVISFSTISPRDCEGHFGPKFPSGHKNLKIPLLHLSRTMVIASQLAARILHSDKIPVVVVADNVRANNQNLIPPPAGVTSRVVNFRSDGSRFSCRAFAKANGDPYAEIQSLSFELVPVEKFVREKNIATEIPEDLFDGYKIKREIYRTAIEELIMERTPFHRLDRAILLESTSGDLRLITVSSILESDCGGQLFINGESTISLIDYSRVMALTAELLASIVTRDRFNGFSVVPIAVKVDRVDTPNLALLSPPIIVVAEANVSVENLNNPRVMKRARQLFWADTASVWAGKNQVASMDKVTYALISEDEFWKEAYEDR